LFENVVRERGFEMNTKINTASDSVRFRSILVANLLLALAMLLWSSGFPAVEVLLEVWDPLTLNSTKHFITLILLVSVWIVLDGFRSFLDTPWLKGITIGGIGFGLGTYLILKAQELSDPVIVSIIVVSTPAIATGLEVLLDKRRLKKVFVSGIILAIVGG